MRYEIVEAAPNVHARKPRYRIVADSGEVLGQIDPSCRHAYRQAEGAYVAGKLGEAFQALGDHVRVQRVEGILRGYQWGRIVVALDLVNSFGRSPRRWWSLVQGVVCA